MPTELQRIERSFPDWTHEQHLAFSATLSAYHAALDDYALAQPERRSFLFDVFTTACEGGIGYWSLMTTYHLRNADEYDHVGFHALVNFENPWGTFLDIPDELRGRFTLDADDSTCLIVRIDAAVIQRGLTLMQAFNDWTPRSDVLLANYTNGEDGDYDAGEADNIVQLGLFGEIIFG